MQDKATFFGRMQIITSKCYTNLYAKVIDKMPQHFLALNIELLLFNNSLKAGLNMVMRKYYSEGMYLAHCMQTKRVILIFISLRSWLKYF